MNRTIVKYIVYRGIRYNEFNTIEEARHFIDTQCQTKDGYVLQKYTTSVEELERK